MKKTLGFILILLALLGLFAAAQAEDKTMECVRSGCGGTMTLKSTTPSGCKWQCNNSGCTYCDDAPFTIGHSDYCPDHDSCPNCGAAGSGFHQYEEPSPTDAEVKDPATCCTYPTYWCTCSVCGKSAKDDPAASDCWFNGTAENSKLDPDKHSNPSGVIGGNNPSCNKDGNYSLAYCSGCQKYFCPNLGTVYDSKPENWETGEGKRPADPSLHKPDDYNGQMVAATCTKAGIAKYYTCRNCKKKFTS